ncbi:MAG: Asp-tRNA(Asn)/Glu-tRNA(Gln) amidotransferase subunit GatB [Chitinophagales bacterium]
MDISTKYETVIGLEIHVQLQTESKIFAPDTNGFGAEPNTNISYITLGHPGTLPFANERIMEYAVKIGLATHCKIERYNRFARKNYFYADLPKGYQITQNLTPICYDGFLPIEVNGEVRKIGITRIHLEEDAGKSTHDQDPDYSLIDLNRAGTPLVEIVSEPDIRSADEAYQYVSDMRRIVRYLGISDADMEKGNLRCDVNISMRLRGAEEYGERVEVKNINSLRNVKRAIEFEAKRQVKLLEKGKQVERQTRSFDASNGTTFSLRDKELAHDYRYFPEPDLQPMVVSEEFIAAIKAEMPEMPHELQHYFTEKLELSAYDAGVLTDEKEMAAYFCEAIKHTEDYKAVANWLIGPVKEYLNKNNVDIGNFALSAKQLVVLIHLIKEDKLSFSIAAQKLLPEWVEQPNADPLQLAKRMNLLMQSDDRFIEEVIEKVLERFPDKVKAYQNGRKGMTGFFMGQIMQLSKGKADPKLATKLLEDRLKSLTV